MGTKITVKEFAEQQHFKQLQAENEDLKERIKFAVGYLPECPDKAKSFLIPVLKNKEEDK